MKARIAALIFIGSLVLARADQVIESVQQALKNQGFYYGEITGEKNADLTAAIRRYQIRNGLQVNGELNNETLQSLRMNSSASAQPAGQDCLARLRSRRSQVSNLPSKEQMRRRYRFSLLRMRHNDQPVFPSAPGAPSTSGTGVLARTPFEAAPPEVQRNVIVSAQIALARRGFYHQEVNGVYGPAMEFSLRAYQARTRLPVTGQLDLQTLAALRLLPQPRQPFYDPARRRWRPPPGPPVRGEWVPE